MMTASPSVSGTNSQWYIAVRANCALDQSIIVSILSNISLVFISRLRMNSSFYQFISYVVFLFFGRFAFEERREEKKFQDKEHNEKFD